ISRIGDFAFSDDAALVSVTLSSGLGTIGSSAFSLCGSLTTVVIPNTVANIFTNAFFNCISLRSVTIPSSVSYIAPLAFGACPSLVGALFLGNAPYDSDGTGFQFSPTTLFYLSGATGWGNGYYGSTPIMQLPPRYNYAINNGQWTITGYNDTNGI